MKAPKNRRVFVTGYAAATALGSTLTATWERAARGETGFCRLTRCSVDSRSNIVGEIPDWHPDRLEFVGKKDAGNWNADFVFLTMMLCRDALADAGLAMDEATGPQTACLIGSALNGTDAYRVAMDN
ncbi:MAG: beta-ketoacyl synthase N-terminal-like domain-containing protein, partial [Desulfobacteraceae bacterium]